MRANGLYRLHGLTIDSDLDLAAPHDENRDRKPDLTVRRGPWMEAPRSAPEGRIVGQSTDPDGTPFYTAAVADGATVLRFHNVCDFAFSPAGDSVEWRLHRGATAEMAGVMATGTMVSVALVLSGHLVLHASAVSVGTEAVAFVGQPGRGKSTLATLACHAGCSLVTDDVLRVEGARCYRGSTQARLRPGTAFLDYFYEPSRSRPTVDGRFAVEMAQPEAEILDLRAVVVPRPDPSATTVSAEALPPTRAVVLLTRFPRLAGWQDPTTNAAQFHRLVDLTGAVPVWRVTVPWPPSPKTAVPELLEAVGVPLPCERT